MCVKFRLNFTIAGWKWEIHLQNENWDWKIIHHYGVISHPNQQILGHQSALELERGNTHGWQFLPSLTQSLFVVHRCQKYENVWRQWIYFIKQDNIAHPPSFLNICCFIVQTITQTFATCSIQHSNDFYLLQRDLVTDLGRMLLVSKYSISIDFHFSPAVDCGQILDEYSLETHGRRSVELLCSVHSDGPGKPALKSFLACNANTNTFSYYWP